MDNTNLSLVPIDSLQKHVEAHLNSSKATPFIIDRFKEICRRVEQTHVEMIDRKAELANTTNTDFKVFNTFVRWWQINELSAFNSMGLALFQFNTNEHPLKDIFPNGNPAQHTSILNNFGRVFYVLAKRSYDNNWVAFNYHLVEGDVVVDVSKARCFTTFASEPSHVTKTGIYSSNKRLREQVARMQEAFEYKNVMLDALGLVYCTGPCGGGQFRYIHHEPLDVKTVVMLFGYASRLLRRTLSRSGYIEKTTQQHSNTTSLVAKHNLQEYVANAHARMDALIDQAQTIPETADIETITSYLLSQGILTMGGDGAGLFALSVDSSEWFDKPHHSVMVSGHTELREVYVAYMKKPTVKKWQCYGLMNWCYKKLKNVNPKPEFIEHIDLPIVTNPDNFFQIHIGPTDATP